MRLLMCVLAFAFIGCVLCRKSYVGHKVYEVALNTPDDVKLIKYFEQKNAFDFWTKTKTDIKKPVVVRVPPEHQNVFEKYLIRHRISYHILIDDVEATVQRELDQHAKKPKYNGRISFDQYYRHDEINAYLADLEKNYPELAKTEVIGKTYEGRNITLIHISSGGSNKPVIFIDAGIHAREWIAPAMALYIINQLVENPSNARLLEKVDWTILPSLNPDGYEYCWTEDRMWRKTRSKGKYCDGADPNRNFDYHWMESGASDDECTEIYAGPKAFSEKNAQALRDYLLGAVEVSDVALYLTLHSYGQYLLYPWGYDDSLPPNWQELDDLGHGVNDAIQAVRGTEYTVGSSTNVLYAAAGASDDWSMGRAGIQLVYTIELPGGGNQGFDLPPEEIKGVAEETWQGILVYHGYVASKAAKAIK